MPDGWCENLLSVEDEIRASECNELEIEMKPFWSTGDVAEYCHVSPSTVFRWIRKGYLSAYTTPGGHHRILPDEFRAFLERNGLPVREALHSDPAVEGNVGDDGGMQAIEGSIELNEMAAQH